MTPNIQRRTFLRRSGVWGAGLLASPALLAACGDDDDAGDDASAGPGPTTPASVDEANEQAEAIVGDVVDFALTSDEWAGDFGFVTLAVHEGVVDGSAVWFIHTDASEQAYAEQAQVVWVPKMATLTGDGLAGRAYTIDDGSGSAPMVLSTQPGRPDYSPAFVLHRVSFTGDPRPLGSEQEVRDAEAAGAVTVENTGIVVNLGVVKWADGEMPVDRVRTDYLGDGQLLEPVDTVERRVTFKLSQCYPGSRYIVLDHSFQGAAENTNTVWSPALGEGPSAADATGRTNVFANGLDGPGPMGAQPSVFDFDAGDAAWSPYWDHWLYQWRDSATPRLLKTQEELFAARDAGELDEIPGVPPTNGEIFTVNCPVPVLAPVTYIAP